MSSLCLAQMPQVVLDGVFEMLTFDELKQFFRGNRRLQQALLTYLMSSLKILTLPDLDSPEIFLRKTFVRLRRLRIFSFPIGFNFDENNPCIVAPSLKMLELQIPSTVSMSYRFFLRLAHQNPQLKGISIDFLAVDRVDCQDLEMEQGLKLFSREFYVRLRNLKSIVITTNNQYPEDSYSIQNVLFYALFVKPEKISVKNVKFESIRMDFDMFSCEPLTKNHQITKLILINPYQILYQKDQKDFAENTYGFCMKFFGQHLKHLKIINKSEHVIFNDDSVDYSVILTSMMNYFHDLKKFCLLEHDYQWRYMLQDSQKTRINFLSILGLPHTYQVMADLSQVMMQTHEVEKLKLDFSNINDQDLEILSQKVHKLKNLSLRNCDALGKQALKSFFKSTFKLSKLDVRGISNLDSEIFLTIQNNNPKMKKLRIAVNHQTNISKIDLTVIHYSFYWMVGGGLSKEYTWASIFTGAYQSVNVTHLKLLLNSLYSFLVFRGIQLNQLKVFKIDDDHTFKIDQLVYVAKIAPNMRQIGLNKIAIPSLKYLMDMLVSQQSLTQKLERLSVQDFEDASEQQSPQQYIDEIKIQCGKIKSLVKVEIGYSDGKWKSVDYFPKSGSFFVR